MSASMFPESIFPIGNCVRTGTIAIRSIIPKMEASLGVGRNSAGTVCFIIWVSGTLSMYLYSGFGAVVCCGSGVVISSFSGMMIFGSFSLYVFSKINFK